MRAHKTDHRVTKLLASFMLSVHTLNISRKEIELLSNLVQPVTGQVSLALQPATAYADGCLYVRCEVCKSGRYHLCDNVVFAASPPFDGTLAGFVGTHVARDDLTAIRVGDIFIADLYVQYSTQADLCYKLADVRSSD